MDKIIDGIDVSGCSFYIQDYQRANNIEGKYEHCKDVCVLNGDNYFYCKMNKDCYYKQLQKLKHQYADVLKLAKENADSNEFCLQELEQENERLKEESKEKAVITKAYNDLVIEIISNIPYAGEIRPDNITPLDVLRNIKKERKAYKQTLQEIRDIAEKMYNTNDEDTERDLHIELQTKINEVIGE